MSPQPGDDVRVLKARVADLEIEVERLKLGSPDYLFRQLAESAPIMIWMSGPDALCTYFNPEWLRFRGRTLAEETGHGWTSGLHPDDRDLAIETYLRAFGSRQPFRLQFRLERADGEYCWVENVGVPRFEPGDVFAGFLGAAADATARRARTFTPDEQAARMVFALTEREREVLVLVAQGKTTKEAATQLGITYKTADSHRSRILEKLGVHETASMVRYAIRAGLIEA